jgi:hypothetical protein
VGKIRIHLHDNIGLQFGDREFHAPYIGRAQSLFFAGD